MKLTDANKIRDYVKEQLNPYGKPFEGSVYEFGLKIMHYIDNMSTDYDIDKVVEELEEKKQNALEVEESIKEYNVLNDAIEIVKQGGVADDCCEWEPHRNNYVTSCGEDFVPMMRGYKYCPYCSKKLKVVDNNDKII